MTVPGPGQSFAVSGTPDPPRFFFSNDQMYSGQQTNLQNSGECHKTLKNIKNVHRFTFSLIIFHWLIVR